MVEKKSRVIFTGKNIIWGYLGSFVTILLSFVTRTAFIKTIGIDYLGINGLFSSVLGVLSLTELGIGAAMTYSLYKPFAENDIETVKSLMSVYKKAYRWVAVIVSVIGLILLPFLDVLIKDSNGIEHLELYYIIFLFNTVSSYFVSYKYGVVNADQKNYLITNINTLSSIVINVAQIIGLVVFGNYIIFLIIQAVFQLAQKIYIALYINKKYDFINDKNVAPLAEGEKKLLIKNIKALICHKIGDISVNQTDNIIISAFVSLKMVGLISNYTLITSTIGTFVNIAFAGTTGSLGNLFAEGDGEKQYSIFKVFDFVGFWIFGFSTIAMFALIQPFIALLWGEEYTIALPIVALILVNNFMVGQRVPIYNIKVAGGVFQQDQFLALIQSAINLVASIVLVKLFGTIGVFVGTIIAGFIPTFIRPYIVFKHLLKRSSKDYYLRYFSRFALMSAISAVCYFVVQWIVRKLTIVTFALAVVVVAIIPNGIFVLLYRKTNEFAYLVNAVKMIIGKMKRSKS